MKKLKIIFKDKSQIIYTIKDYVAWQPYFTRHSASDIKNATLQQYPLKNNKLIVLIGEVTK